MDEVTSIKVQYCIKSKKILIFFLTTGKENCFILPFSAYIQACKFFLITFGSFLIKKNHVYNVPVF